MVARNRRAVMSVCGKFENEYYHRYCKTKINASCRHLLLVCCHFEEEGAKLPNPIKKEDTRRNFSKSFFKKFFQKVFSKSFFFPEKMLMEMLMEMLMNMLDAYGDAYQLLPSVREKIISRRRMISRT
jgi:hypothetical protein